MFIADDTDIKVQTKKCFTPFIHLDPDILIASLRSTLLLKSGDIDEDFLKVTADYLNNEFRISLQSFYPNGVIMAEMEQTEASELFSFWKETQDQHFRSATQEFRVPKAMGPTKEILLRSGLDPASFRTYWKALCLLPDCLVKSFDPDVVIEIRYLAYRQ